MGGECKAVRIGIGRRRPKLLREATCGPKIGFGLRSSGKATGDRRKCYRVRRRSTAAELPVPLTRVRSRAQVR